MSLSAVFCVENVENPAASVSVVAKDKTWVKFKPETAPTGHESVFLMAQVALLTL